MLTNNVLKGVRFNKNKAESADKPSHELLRAMFQFVEAMCLAISPTSNPSDIWSPKAPVEIGEGVSKAATANHYTMKGKSTITRTSLAFFGALLDVHAPKSLEEYLKIVE